MRKLSAIFLILVLLVSSVVPVTAANTDVQYQYSTKTNSGKRHEVCTTLEGTNAGSYYTGSYTFDILSEKSGNTLLQSLRTLMKSTHKKNSTYANCRDMAEETDCENNNGRIVTIYTSYSTTHSEYKNGQGWNREHVWPKSLGGFETSGAGADLHHIRPSEAVPNSTRGNKKYGNVSGSKVATGNLSKLPAGTYDGTYYEPLDNVKGDVARICLYVYVRYGGDITQCGKITNVFQSVDVLLEWCALDPVDTWEMGRNEVVAAYQGNRNVFIDYPEYAWLIFDREIPEDLQTPTSASRETCESGHSYGNWVTVKEATVKETGLRRRTCNDCGKVEEEVIPKLTCTHQNVTKRNEKAATCTQPGYTGDTWCNTCGKQIATGKEIPITEHTYGDWVTEKEATVTDTGLRKRTCGGCGDVEEEVIPKLTCTHENVTSRNEKDATCEGEGHTGDMYCADCGEFLAGGSVIPALGHSYGDWTIIKEATVEETGLRQHTCSGCGDVQEEVIPKLDPQPSAPTQPTQPTQPSVPAETNPAPTVPSMSGNGQEQQPKNLTWLWICVTVAVVGVLAIAFIKRKR